MSLPLHSRAPASPEFLSPSTTRVRSLISACSPDFREPVAKSRYLQGEREGYLLLLDGKDDAIVPREKCFKQVLLNMTGARTLISKFKTILKNHIFESPHGIGSYKQGITKRLRPGLVNERRKYSILLPAAGSRTQFFHLLFTKPGRSLLAEPCTCTQTRILSLRGRSKARPICIKSEFSHPRNSTLRDGGREGPENLCTCTGLG